MVLADGSARQSALQRTRRLDEWREAIRDNFVALDIAADRRAGGFDGTVRSTALGHLQVSEVRSTPQTCRRTAGLARADHAQYLQVGMLVRGGAVLEQDGRRAVLGAGDFAVYETDRPFRWDLTGGWELFVLTWPRATMDLTPGESAARTARRLDGRTGLTAIVGAMMRELVTAPPALSAAGAVRVADEVGRLLATAVTEEIAAPPGSGSARANADLVRRIDEHLAARLADPDLGPASVARAHHISTRQLHRLFAQQGDTVARRIHRLRLERCRRDLLDRARADQAITMIARHAGFTDPARFSRAFRAAYGLPPSEYRARYGSA
ncbi:MAG TPA: helix-turn-helix domain-containing protein [Pseudonocardia sp.]|nr:helix-turn-helix domain-containing protein [Pseudonocardia sp.]